MSYLGSGPAPSVVQFSTLDSQAFNGDGSTTAFTLNRAVSIAASIEVTVNNVQQSPYDGSYTVNGTTTLTFSEAPSSGTDNIYVRFLDYPLASITPGDGTVGLDQLSATGTPSSSTFLRGDNSWQAVSVTPTAVSDQANSSTGYFDLPAGTTAQRPGTPATGMIRYNTSNYEYEVYDSVTAAWVKLSTESAGLYSVEYIVVAGGGGGGSNAAGAGGGGGYRSSVQGESSGGGSSAESVYPVVPTTSYTVTIGAGGTVNFGNATSNQGSNSVFGTITSIGGGGGGSNASVSSGAGGGNGGSGGGGAVGITAGTGTSGQGRNGGTGYTNNSSACAGGGGGGANTAGSNASSGASGNGGNGVQSSINGTATYYAGGGAGEGFNIPNGTAGLGGGGSVNTGGGGNVNAQGGSGIVIIRYLGPQRGTGGTVTSSGGYTIHTFTTSGTYTA